MLEEYDSVLRETVEIHVRCNKYRDDSALGLQLHQVKLVGEPNIREEGVQGLI